MLLVTAVKKKEKKKKEKGKTPTQIVDKNGLLIECDFSLLGYSLIYLIQLPFAAATSFSQPPYHLSPSFLPQLAPIEILFRATFYPLLTVHLGFNKTCCLRIIYPIIAGGSCSKMGRHSCCYKQKLRKGLWSPEEDEKLLRHITKYGHGCWSSVPKQAGICFLSLILISLSAMFSFEKRELF